MSTSYQRHMATLNDLKVAYESKGFRFYIEPNRSLLPNELVSFKPDAIALNENEKVVIEVVDKGQKNYKSKVSTIKSQLSSLSKDWIIEIVYIPKESRKEYKLPTESELHSISSQIEDLVAQDFLEPAVILSFAAIEAVGRLILKKANSEFDERTVGSSLFGTLEENSFLTPRNSNFIRMMWKKRNSYAHGYFSSSEISAVDTERLKNIAALLYNEAGISFSDR